MNEGLQINLHSFVTSILDGGECSASRLGAYYTGNYPPVSFGYEVGVEPRAGRRDKNPYLWRHSKFSHQPILQSHLALPANACISTLITLNIQDRPQFMLGRLVSITVVPQRTGNLVLCASYSTRGLAVVAVRVTPI